MVKQTWFVGIRLGTSSPKGQGMQMYRNKGVTFLGMLLILATVVIAGILIIRVIPTYIEHYSVVQAVDALNRLPASDFTGDPMVDAGTLRNKLLNQFTINGVDYITPEQLTVTPDKENHFIVTIKYQVILPLVANANLLFKFDDSREVNVKTN